MATDKPTELSQDEQELLALFPQPAKVKIGNLEWQVYAMDLERYGAFLYHMRPILGTVLAAVKKTPANADLSEPLAPIIIDFAASNPAAFIEAMAVAIGKPTSIIKRLPPGLTPALVSLVVRLNIDFFVQSLVDHAKGNQATTSNGAGVELAGLNQSTTLSPGAMSTQ